MVPKSPYSSFFLLLWGNGINQGLLSFTETQCFDKQFKPIESFERGKTHSLQILLETIGQSAAQSKDAKQFPK